MSHKVERGKQWWNESWNPVMGCSVASPGCDHCWARSMAQRFYARIAKWNGRIDCRTAENAWATPFHWRKSRRVFVCSMGDLFHMNVPQRAIGMTMKAMRLCPRHTFYVLTKRPQNVAWEGGWEDNVWLGVSVESQEWTWRIEILRVIPAKQRFISFEPLLGPVTADLRDIDWIIIGPETGPGKRPMEPAWRDSLIEQAKDADVPVFLKGGK